MSNRQTCHEVALRPLVYETVESQSVLVTSDAVYRGSRGQSLCFDAYRPALNTGRRLPVVLLTTGFPDAGMRKATGCHAKDMQSYRSWARLIAGAMHRSDHLRQRRAGERRTRGTRAPASERRIHRD